MVNLFNHQQEQLQKEFFSIASTSGKPRGLRWTHCDWIDSWVMVHDSETDLLTMFRNINLSFEAIEGGDMEDVEAVSTVREACAVFHGQDGRWGTGGKVLFNMNPEAAAELAAAGQEIVARSK